MKRLVAIAFLFLFFSEANAARIDARVDETPCGHSRVSLEGRITSADVETLTAIFSKIKKLKEQYGCLRITGTLEINSEGGDVAAALAIGRQIRALNLSVQTKRCASACVFILAAGVSRNIFPTVDHKSNEIIYAIEIHRPYFTDLPAGTSQMQIQRLRSNQNAVLRAYLGEMNIAAGLLDEMNSVPPESSRRLNDAELEKYFPTRDPDYDEHITLIEAEGYGLSVGEYRRRTAFVDSKCGKPDWLRAVKDKENSRISICRESFLFGISEQAYIVNATAANDYCNQYSGHIERWSSCISLRIRSPSSPYSPR